MTFFSASDNPLHAEYGQLKRQRRALNLKMDSVDFDGQTGKIGKQSVSLESCTCSEFFHRHKPCNHMYRLAFELGVFELDAEKIKVALKTAPRLNPYGCEISFPDSVPKNFVVIDFENANHASDSICQMGIVVVENNSVTAQENFLIRPPYKEFTATEIHGITFKDVKNKPTFKKLWGYIKKFIEGKTIAAYGLSSDLHYLFATLDRYKIPHPNFDAFDILANVRACQKLDENLAELENIQLGTVAKKFELNHNAHDALSDALATAQIQIYLSKNFPDEMTTTYISTIATLIKKLRRGKIPLEVIADYCRVILNIADLDCEEYADFFELLEQIALERGDKILYKFCDEFYEKCLHSN